MDHRSALRGCCDVTKAGMCWEWGDFRSPGWDLMIVASEAVISWFCFTVTWGEKVGKLLKVLFVCVFYNFMQMRESTKAFILKD